MPGEPVRVRDREAVTKSRSYQPLQSFRELFLSTRIQLLLVAALVLIANQASAADFPVKITAARVGLPSGGGDTGAAAKFACWAPVYVDLELTGPVADAAELVVEAADPDEISTSLAVPINLAGASGKVSAAERGAIGCVRPAELARSRSRSAPRTAARRSRAVSHPITGRASVDICGVSLAQPTGFDLPKPTTGAADQSAGLRGGRVEFRLNCGLRALPDQWFGYEAADLVVLHTGPARTSFSQTLRESASAAEKVKQFAPRSGSVAAGDSSSRSANAGTVRVSRFEGPSPFEVNGSRAPPRSRSLGA